MSSSRKASMSGSVEKEKSAVVSERAGTSSSKAYSSHLAVQTDATKYRGKYKELKKKVRQIELENDKLHFKTLRIKRNIQRMRLERAILYERLEAEIGENAALAENENNIRVRRTFLAPSERAAAAAAAQEQQSRRGSASQHSNSTPSGRRVIDYSPSPEDAKPAGAAVSGGGNTAPIAGVPPAAASSSSHDLPAHAPATNGEARSGMKVTLKRHSQANGKEPSW